MRTIVATVALALVAPAAHAYCAVPSEPLCLNLGRVDELCRSQVERYLKALDAYVGCTQSEAERLAQAVLRKWDCKAQGSQSCA